MPAHAPAGHPHAKTTLTLQLRPPSPMPRILGHRTRQVRESSLAQTRAHQEAAGSGGESPPLPVLIAAPMHLRPHIARFSTCATATCTMSERTTSSELTRQSGMFLVWLARPQATKSNEHSQKDTQRPKFLAPSTRYRSTNAEEGYSFPTDTKAFAFRWIWPISL